MSQTQLCVENWMDILPPDYQTYRITANSFDMPLLNIYSAVKILYPEMFVNFKDGKRIYSWCGYRTPDCSIGAANSAHKTGKALDLHMPTADKTRELYEWCLINGINLGIRRMESWEATKPKAAGATGWVHIDTMPPNEARWKDRAKPYVFVP